MTITIRLPDEFEAKLRARLENSDMALSEFVRNAIAEKLEREPPQDRPSAYELGKHVFGKYTSGRPDLAENAEQILKEMFDAKRRG
jgi:Arc/MetJ-type ribon-helix-helix transcriptional regulator